MRWQSSNVATSIGIIFCGRASTFKDRPVKVASESQVKFDSKVLETSGAISTAICDFSRRTGVGLIVLGTRANASPLTKMMLGSVALGVTSNADCAVLVVR